MFLVSIIIPIYNVEKYLRECLKSVTNQTLQDIEIICVNDGSTDNSFSILEEYAKKDSRIKIITQKNSGAGVARNNGLSVATGKNVYFMDGDDILALDALETLVNAAERLQADIVVFDFYRMDNVTKKLEYRNGLNRSQFPYDKGWFNYKDVPNNILRIVNPTPWNKLYNTEFIKNTGLKYLEISSTNDITFAALSVAMAQKIGYVPQPFLYYRVNLNHSITSIKQKNLDNVITAVMSVKNQALQLPYGQDIKASIQSFMMDNLIFALKNYAGKPFSPYYKKYYQKIKDIFNDSFFDDATEQSIGNKRIYDEYLSIKNNALVKVHYLSINNAMKERLKRILRSNKYTGYMYRLLRSIYRDGIFSTVRKVKNKVQVIVRENRLVIRNGVTVQKREPKIIVSLTTYPARIKKVDIAIKSLLNQTMKPDLIILWLAEEQFPGREKDLPKKLLQLCSYGLEIKWCKDFKSYKKLIPTLCEYPSDIIITVDDDLLYEKYMIEKLYNSYIRHPQSISCMRAHLIHFDNEGNILPYADWTKECSKYIDEPRMDLFATTGAGTLFPPGILPEETTNEEIFTNKCPNADDIWIKVMSIMNKVPIVLVDQQKPLVYVSGTQNECLWHSNIDAGENDRQLNLLLAEYDISLSNFS